MLFDTIIMVDTINVFSFNDRGLGNKIKRIAIFEWLNSKRGVIFSFKKAILPQNQRLSGKSSGGGGKYFSPMENQIVMGLQF